MEESEELSSCLKFLNEENPDRMITKDNIIDLLKVSVADEKAEIVAKWKRLLPRNSVSVENRYTIQRRYLNRK